jgi:hypothetical protein
MLWDARRIHDELLMLGFDVSQATVSRYIRRCVRPRSPGWRSFAAADAGVVAFGHDIRQAIIDNNLEPLAEPSVALQRDRLIVDVVSLCAL